MTYFPISEFSYKDWPSLDAFGRLRTSSQTQLIDLKQLKDKLPLFFDEVIGWAWTSTHSATTASTNMAVTGGTDYVIRQTYRRFPYYAGKSDLIDMTFAGFQPEANVEKEVWYYNSSSAAPYSASLDWILLRSSGGVVTAYTYRSGTITNQEVQSNWNLDKLDGTWPSWITVDWSLSQILVVDFQYLWVGRVRLWLSVDWQLYYFHQFNNANNLSDVYMSSPNHSIRYSIRSTGWAGSFKTICASVASEGSNNELSKEYSINRGTTLLSATTAGTKYCSQAYRLATWFEDAFVKLMWYSIDSFTNDDLLFEIILNPTIAWALAYSAVTNTVIESAVWATANTVTGWFVLASWYITQFTSENNMKASVLSPWVKINGTRDVIALVITPLSASATVLTALNIQESL